MSRDVVFPLELSPVSRAEGRVNVDWFLAEGDLSDEELSRLQVADRVTIRDEGGNLIPAEISFIGERGWLDGHGLPYFGLTFQLEQPPLRTRRGRLAFDQRR